MGVSFQRSLWSSFERMQGIIDLLHWFIFILIIISIFKTGTSYKQDWLISKKNKNYILDISKIFNWRVLISINATVSLYMGLMSLDLYYTVNIFFDNLLRLKRVEIVFLLYNFNHNCIHKLFEIYQIYFILSLYL